MRRLMKALIPTWLTVLLGGGRTRLSKFELEILSSLDSLLSALDKEAIREQIAAIRLIQTSGAGTVVRFFLTDGYSGKRMADTSQNHLLAVIKCLVDGKKLVVRAFSHDGLISDLAVRPEVPRICKSFTLESIVPGGRGKISAAEAIDRMEHGKSD